MILLKEFFGEFYQTDKSANLSINALWRILCSKYKGLQTRMSILLIEIELLIVFSMKKNLY